MARPKKEGLDYFPLDVDIDQDDKVLIIQSKYGMEGFGVLIKLLMEIYKNGYYYNWTEKEQLIFSSRVNVNINKVSEIVNDCIKWDFFNKEKFEKHHVLTSRGIQNRYLLATTRRLDVDINDDLKLVNVDINPKSSEKVLVESTQSKVKESKVNKTKIPYAEIIDFLNEKANKNFSSSTKKTKDLIKARWNEGYTLEQFKLVIDHCCKEWKGKKFNNGQMGDNYLQPSTLFNGKFDERLNLSSKKEDKPKVEYKSDSVDATELMNELWGE